MNPLTFHFPHLKLHKPHTYGDRPHFVWCCSDHKLEYGWLDFTDEPGASS